MLPQNPAYMGQKVYDSKEVQDKQIVRLIGAGGARVGEGPFMLPPGMPLR